MKKMTAIIAGAIFMSGCATEGKFVGASRDNDCDGKGRTEAFIRYGDSRIQVTPLTSTKRKGEIIFTLMPQSRPSSSIDYAELEITINGKEPSDQWLNTSGKASDGKKVFVCVDENQPLGTYQYLVHVPGVGTIDPRVEVNN